MTLRKMNHKTINNNNKTAPVLVAIAALAAVMIAGTITVGSGNMAFAGSAKGNDGISVPTKTNQNQECNTAGGASPITGSCTAASTNVITQTGGILGELTKQGKSGSEGMSTLGDNGKGRDNGNSGISVPTDTNKHQECNTAGGASPITGSCTALSTNTNTQLGGLMGEVKVR